MISILGTCRDYSSEGTLMTQRQYLLLILDMPVQYRVKYGLSDVTDKPTITIQRAPMQLQRGGSDCGLFAIASATAICNGQSPENIQFDQSQMRPHLLKCLEDKLLMPFPSTIAPRRRPRITLCERIHVYCTCRLPDEGRKMVQCTSCTRWYHCDCMKISTKRMKSIENSNRPWYCGNPCHC